jgi:serine phosphatase RsbU (regulator of sigma subunit)/anti-sigma regulatory factor (Ser/Thr protein kinase)/transposase
MRIFARPTKEVFAEYPSLESKLPDIRNFIDTVLKETPFRRKDITAILLAIEEACTNVIRHAYLMGEGTLKLRITLYSDRMQISIFDTGRSFDFEKESEPDLNRYIKTGRKGGLGIYLIRKITDEVSYRSRNGVNELRMVKRYPRMKPDRVTTVRGMSLRVKFSVWTSLVMTAIIVTVYFYWESKSVSALQETFADSVKEYAGTIATQAANFFLNNASDVEFDEYVRNFASEDSDIRFISIVNNNNVVVATTEPPTVLHQAFEPPPGVNPKITSEVQYYNTAGDHDINFYARPIRKSGRLFGHVYMAFSEARLNANIASARRGILVIVGLAFLFSIVAVYLLANYFVKPIQRLIEGVRRIGRGDLESKITLEGAGEFNAIAEAFNEMTVKFKEAQDNLVEQEKMRKEMQVAQDIQHALLPKQFPDVEGFDIATIYKAAKDVGGDYYDFVWIDPNTLGIVVADVSGKGVPGSLVMTMIRTAIRLESRGNRSAVDVLSRVNDFVTEDVRKGMFITLFLVVLDTRYRKISFASAGHNPMVLYRRDEDKTYFLNPKGIPLGITLPDGISFEENLKSESVRLKQDDMLIIYTDGITEAMDRQKRQYGMPRFLEFIRNHSDLTPEEFVEMFSDDLKTYCGGAEQNDDITMVIIKEKIEADEYIFARRKKLLDLVEKEGKPVAEACRLMDLSPSTYYRYRKRYELYGDEGLLNKRLRIEDEPAQLTFEQRNLMLAIVRESPEFGATRIARELEQRGNGGTKLDEKAVYAELVRLRLNNRRQRYEYVERMGGQLSSEQKAEFERLNADLEAGGPRLDRQAYVEQIKESLQQKEADRVAHWRDRLVEQGIRDERGEIVTAMFSELEGKVTPDQLDLLVGKIAERLGEIDKEAEKKNVFSTVKIEEEGADGWRQRAEEGIDLEVIDLPEEDSDFDMDEYEKKMSDKRKGDDE